MVLAVVVAEDVNLDDIRARLAIICDGDEAVREVTRPMGHEEQLVRVEWQVERRLCDVLEVVDRGDTVRVELPVREGAIVRDVDRVVVHLETASSASESMKLGEHARERADRGEH